MKGEEKMSTARILEFKTPQEVTAKPALYEIKQQQTEVNNRSSHLKSNGQPKATKADPIREVEDINRLQRYFLEQGDYRDYMIVTLGISFALRAGDLLSLTLGDVYEANGRPKDVFYIHEEKTSKRRRVNINSTCRDILAENWWRLDEHNLDDPLFTSRNRDRKTGRKKAITLIRLNQILAKAQKELGIDDHISSHCLRKTHAYQTLQKASDKQEALYAMQHKLNHSDARITMIYCGIEDDVVKKFDEGIGELLK